MSTRFYPELNIQAQSLSHGRKGSHEVTLRRNYPELDSRDQDESDNQMMNWVQMEMALRTHSYRTKGVYKDNLPRIARVEVETKKR